MLYLLKFTPRLFHKIWGGNHIKSWYTPVSDSFNNVGEAWLISAVEKYPTEVVNGPHAGDSLQDLLEVYMSDLVGDSIYERFGNTFPLLIKFIDAIEDLSVQVHPNDQEAWEKEGTLGKTEMWYVMDSEPEASIFMGWKEDMTIPRIAAAIEDGTLQNHLCHYPVSKGDVALIHANTVHSIAKGTVVAEIQENSDITYRLYDYNRVGNDGKKRPLRLDDALDVMNFSAQTDSQVLRTHNLSSTTPTHSSTTPSSNTATTQPTNISHSSLLSETIDQATQTLLSENIPAQSTQNAAIQTSPSTFPTTQNVATKTSPSTFQPTQKPTANTTPQSPSATSLVATPFFTTNRLQFSSPIARDYTLLDSFVIYICTEGELTVQAQDLSSDLDDTNETFQADNTDHVTTFQTDNADHTSYIAEDDDTIPTSVHLKKGEAILVPACLNDITLLPQGPCELLEVYIDKETK